MILGILSDTHGKADVAGKAVRLLLLHGAEYLVHCGDVGGKGVVDQLAGHPAMFVFGNTDWDRHELARYAEDLGIVCGQNQGKLEFDEKRVVVTHGDDERIVRQVLTEQTVDYLLLGHTHQTMDRREGRVRIINPGALYRTAEKTVAVLDTTADTLEILRIPSGI